MRSRADITAAILAGGEGRRVGGNDKGLLELAGKPLVAHVAATLRDQVGSIFICANRHAHEYAHFGTVIPDTQPGFHGPLAGIAAALERCQTHWMLTVPVDAPNPPADLAERLLAAVDAAQADAAVAHDGVRRQPLFALYRARVAESAFAALAANRPVHGWQDLIGAVELDFSDRAPSFVNLNTLDELREWEKHHAG